MEHQSLITYLKKKADISSEDESKIIHYFKPNVIKKRKTFVSNILSANKLYFISKGLLRAFYYDEKGREFTRMIAWENKFLANIFSFKPAEYSTEIFECLEDAEILTIDKQNLDTLLSTSYIFQRIYCDLLEEYHAIHLKHFHVISSDNVRHRIHYLKTDYPHLLGRVNDTILASFLCISRETFVRHKSELYK